MVKVKKLQEIERFGSVHDATLKGMPLPPISVTRGSQGVSVSEIIFNWGR
jgi:hypothetical protein